MSYRLLQVTLLALACAACGSRQIAEPGSADSGVETSAGDADAEAGDAGAEAEAGLRQYPCTVANDCERYFGTAALCVGSFCCLGQDDGHHHCVCGTLDGGCQDPRKICCGHPLECHDLQCPGF